MIISDNYNGVGKMATFEIAKKWFKANPKNKVIFHHREKELSASSREVLFDTIRTVNIHGNRAVFSPHQSSLSLPDLEWETMVDELIGTHAGYVIVKYKPAI